MCQKDSSNLTHTVRFDVSIYCPIGEPEVTNEQMTHLLKLDTFFHTHDVRIMTYDALRIRTTHHVDLAIEDLSLRAYERYPNTFSTLAENTYDLKNQKSCCMFKMKICSKNLVRR